MKEDDDIRDMLKEKDEDLANVEALNETLIVKELKSKAELQAACWELNVCIFVPYSCLFGYISVVLFN